MVDRNGKPLAKPFWKDDSPEGTPRVEVDLSAQVARVYFDDKLVGQSPICAGRPGNETPVGEFSVIHKRENHESNLYGSWIDANGNYQGEANAGDNAPRGFTYQAAPMPHFMRLTYDGVGFHAGYIQGYPASHGCIRLPKEMAEKFFEHLPEKTKVVIADPSRPKPKPEDKPVIEKPVLEATDTLSPDSPEPLQSSSGAPAATDLES
jgi:lipoprotein-anchoring transpeptidase ErfK/SrfK